MLRYRLPQSWKVLLLCGLAASGGFAQSPDGRFASRDNRYRLDTSDVIEILFTFTPEFNQVVTIQPDGFIALKNIGEIKVGGLTVAEATKELTTQYSATLHNPRITLILKDFSKPSFIIAGDVTKPGKYELHGDVTLMDAIAIAGGFVPGANRSEILLFRRVLPDLAEVKKVNVKRMLNDRELKEDPALRPGDSIYVSRSVVGKIDTFMKISRLGIYFPLPAIP